MRTTMRVLAVLVVLCLLGGVGLILANGSTGGDMSPLILPGFALLGVGVLCALGSALLGIIATVMYHQRGWLVAVIVAALFPLIGWIAISLLTWIFPYATNQIENVGIPGSALGGPLLLAVIVFVYSFRMRDPAAVAPLPRRTAPLR